MVPVAEFLAVRGVLVVNETTAHDLVQLARCRQTAGEPDAEEELRPLTPSDVRFADCLYESLMRLARGDEL